MSQFLLCDTGLTGLHVWGLPGQGGRGQATAARVFPARCSNPRRTSPVPACPRPPALVLLATTCAVIAVNPPVAVAGAFGAQTEHAFVDDTNHARVNHDRRVYEVSSDLTDVAQRWARWMARHHTLEHNPSLESDVHHWQALGENVGSGGAEPRIHRAFMADRYHRDNILSTDYTQVGIGTARDEGGRLYVDEVFRRPSN